MRGTNAASKIMAGKHHDLAAARSYNSLLNSRETVRRTSTRSNAMLALSSRAAAALAAVRTGGQGPNVVNVAKPGTGPLDSVKQNRVCADTN